MVGVPVTATSDDVDPDPVQEVAGLGTDARDRRCALFRMLLRYSGVSALSTTISLTVLASLVASNATSPGWANVIATAVGTGPSFELNRRWVWSRQGRRSLTAEIVPFCALSFIALAVSTLAVSVATGWAAAVGFGSSARAMVAVTANLTAFGTMWVIQFFVLDRVLFRSAHGSRCSGADDETVAGPPTNDAAGPVPGGGGSWARTTGRPERADRAGRRCPGRPTG